MTHQMLAVCACVLLLCVMQRTIVAAVHVSSGRAMNVASIAQTATVWLHWCSALALAALLLCSTGTRRFAVPSPVPHQ